MRKDTGLHGRFLPAQRHINGHDLRFLNGFNSFGKGHMERPKTAYEKNILVMQNILKLDAPAQITTGRHIQTRKFLEIVILYCLVATKLAI